MIFSAQSTVDYSILVQARHGLTCLSRSRCEDGVWHEAKQNAGKPAVCNFAVFRPVLQKVALTPN